MTPGERDIAIRRRASYTAEQRSEAEELYVQLGPTAASRRTGIPKSTLRSWAVVGGLRTVRNEKTAAATEAAQLDAQAKRALLRSRLLDQALEALARMDERHKDFRGKDADEVWWDKAPADAMKNYAMTCAILIDKLRLEEGNATARTEYVDPRQRAHEVLDELAVRRARPA